MKSLPQPNPYLCQSPPPSESYDPPVHCFFRIFSYFRLQHGRNGSQDGTDQTAVQARKR